MGSFGGVGVVGSYLMSRMNIMKCTKILLASVAVAVWPTVALGNPASPESVSELLAVSNTRGVLDQMMTQIDGMMKQSMDAAMSEALKGESLTASQEEIVGRMQEGVLAIMREELAWERLEPMYIEIYVESFTQEEVDGMLEFYKTPAGQATIKKLPGVVRKSMTRMQQRMGPMIEKLKKVQEQFVVELQEDLRKNMDEGDE